MVDREGHTSTDTAPNAPNAPNASVKLGIHNQICMSVIEISPLFSWKTWATACIIACLIDTFLWHIACLKWTLLGFVHVCVAHPCVFRLHILVECDNVWTPVVYWFSPLHRDLKVPRLNPIHVCDCFLLILSRFISSEELPNNSAGVWKKLS